METASRSDNPRAGIRKDPFEPEQLVRAHNIHFTENQWQAIQARCWDLNCRTVGLRIGASTLARDIVVAWLSQTTNWDDPMFHRPHMPIVAIGMPPERYPGYLADLGFEGD
jgi:hypothetical protein